MKFSQGASYCRFGELYNPEVFNDHEEVIVFNEKILQVHSNLL
jgi:hypothetical protein